MVQGINVNNYSVEQLKELKNAGVQGITDKDIEAAQMREAEATEAKKSDEANIEYIISDNASETNEAQEEVKKIEKSFLYLEKNPKSSLRTVLSTFTSKCFEKNNEMKNLNEEMSKFLVTAEDMSKQAAKITEASNAEMKEVETEIKSKLAKARAKRKEAEEQTEIVSKVANNKNATKSDKLKAREASVKIESLGAEAFSAENAVKNMQERMHNKIKNIAMAKIETLGKSVSDIKDASENALIETQNANEYAEVTIEKGMEASNVKSCFQARNLGFGLNKKEAKKMGDTAIAAGEHLGNSTVNVAKIIQNVSNQFDIGFAETSSMNDLLKKEYVDTSALDKLENPDDVKGLVKKLKTKKENQETVTTIAEAVKRKKEEEAKAAAKGDS